MEVTDAAIKFFRPEAATPFVNLYRLRPQAGLANRNPLHVHPDTTEIFAVFRGHLDWQIDGRSYDLWPGDAMVVPPGVVHGTVDASFQASEVIALHLAPDELPPRLAASVAALVVRKTRDPRVVELVHRVFEEHRRQNPLLAEVAHSLGVLLVASLAHPETDQEGRETSRLIRHAQSALMERYGARPTVDEVAARLGVSTAWLNRLFVRETGASPGDWARARRLSEAKRLLREGRLTTNGIAVELGYSSGTALAASLRAECGMTPAEYRALHAEADAVAPAAVATHSMRIYYRNEDGA